MVRRKYAVPFFALCALFLSLACTAQTGGGVKSAGNAGTAQGTRMNLDDITAQIAIESVIFDTDFSPWGRLIFPADSGYRSGTTLGSLRLTWYSHIDTAQTGESIRYFKAQTLRGQQAPFEI